MHWGLVSFLKGDHQWLAELVGALLPTGLCKYAAFR